MRIAGITLWVCCFLTASVRGAAGGVRLVAEENGRVVVEVRFDAAAERGEGNAMSVLGVPGMPPLGYARCFVAVSPGAEVRVNFQGGEYIDRRDNVIQPLAAEMGYEADTAELRAAGFYPQSPVVVSRPFIVRNVTMVAVDCFQDQVDYAAGTQRVWSGYRFELRYPPDPRAIPSSNGDPIVSGLVLNRVESIAGARRGRVPGGSAGPPDRHFAHSNNWVKIRIAASGMNAIRGSDLAQLLVNIGGIDPNTFRLFTGGGRELNPAINDPTATWRTGRWMRECAILVSDGRDGSFEPGDMVIFYGLGARDWLDHYEPGAARTEFHDHLHAKENVYYLTWNSSFPGTPARMDSVAAGPVQAPDVTTFEERLYFERDLVNDFAFGDDGWLWLDITRKSRPEIISFPSFEVKDLVTTVPQGFRTIALAPYCGLSGCVNSNHQAKYWINGTKVAEKVWNTLSADRYENGKIVTAQAFFLKEGLNGLQLEVPRVLNTSDFMYFAFYQVFYTRRLKTVGEELRFSSPDTTGTVNFSVTDFSSGTTPLLFDVTDQFQPRILIDHASSGGVLRFSSDFNADRKNFWAAGSAALKKPARMDRYFPTDLRDVSTSPHMVILCDPAYRSTARSLKSHRERRLPYFSNPNVAVVTTDEVYDNFSGGLPDPTAIRNYCKFLYDNFTDGGGAPLLTFLLLLGDANLDNKNVNTSQPDFIPTYLNRSPFVPTYAYATDDWYALLDSTDGPGSGYGDIAVGRLPAGSVGEAAFMVNRVIQYEELADYGEWRNRVVLAADDEMSSSNNFQADFIVQSETIAHARAFPSKEYLFLPGFVEPFKIYLTEFPAISGIKPASRIAFLKVWNSGALIINFIGHGSSAQMADEQVFLGSDVGNLTNGLRLPLLMAFSCTIGDFGSAQSKSLSERLLLRENGGVIAAVTASQVTFITPNATLNFNAFSELLPRRPAPPEPLGVGLLKAKFKTLSSLAPSRFVEENNQKYNLLGDPAVRLLSPRRSIVFDTGDTDTLTTGLSKTIRGAVYAGGDVDGSFKGTVRLLVREPDDQSGYTRQSDGFQIAYRYPGGKIYQGSADVIAGRFRFDFHVPRRARLGTNAFVLAYAYGGSVDAAVRNDEAFFKAPSGADSTALRPRDGAPRVDLGFQGGIRVVKPGAVLTAVVRDADGINTLGTTNEGKMAMIFDDTNLPVDVTEFFAYDHGGSDTSGTLRYPLIDIAQGDHRAILKVGDSFGQISLDTLRFTVADPQDFKAEVVLNYPNPFASSTYFLITLTDRARVELNIYTVSGRKIRKLDATRDAGDAWVLWDGRDWTGETVANGTYLYVAKVDFVGTSRPPRVLRGTVVKIE